jgi:hypothetical protein
MFVMLEAAKKQNGNDGGIEEEKVPRTVEELKELTISFFLLSGRWVEHDS